MANSRIIEGEGGVMVMATDYGTHPPELYADAASRQLTPLSITITGERRRAAMELRAKFAEILEKHHGRLAEDERVVLLANTGHHAKPLDAAPYLETLLAELEAAAVGTQWEHHFKRGNPDPGVLADTDHAEDKIAAHATATAKFAQEQGVRHVIASHLRTHQHVERKAHADKIVMH